MSSPPPSLTALFRRSAGAAALLSALVAIPVPAGPNPNRAPAQTTPSLNFYGLPGGIDMPSATPMPDGQLAATVSSFGGQTRTTISFQFSPRISASFRYTGIQDWNDGGFDTYRDRSFDARFLLLAETPRWPALTVGLQDLAGTGIYSGEYVVATKTLNAPGRLPGRMTLSGGLGWGRLGSSGDIGAPFSDTRPEFVPGDPGGEPATDRWFRGPMAPFAGIEWQVNNRLGLKFEYSSDAYDPETRRGVFDRKSNVNVGAEYEVTKGLRVGAYYLYGSEFGLSAQLQFNPKDAPAPLTVAGPRPVVLRPSPASQPAAWSTEWTSSESAPRDLRDALTPLLDADGLTLEALRVDARTAELRFSNQRYSAPSIAVGRAARAMAQVLPASVEMFRLVPMRNGLALSTVILRRSDLERLEYAPDGSGRLLAATGFAPASPELAGAVTPENAYPRFAFSIGPYLSPSYFDPDEPVRADAGISAQFNYRWAPGWLLSAELRQRLIGNVEDSDRVSDSLLPPVRTDAVRYARATDFSLNRLYVSRQWKLGQDVYARASAGYLERMFGGVSTEVLWKPVTSALALGAEVNYAKQRDFDQGFGFQDYDVTTGHLSAYYDFGAGYLGQVDVGRYLAGDTGATVTLTREFANGWRVGGFFTLTDVSSEEFGEGSFDKGIQVEVPLSWFTARPNQEVVSTTIRPVQRDGGARLNAPGRLYQQVRGTHARGLTETWPRVYE